MDYKVQHYETFQLYYNKMVSWLQVLKIDAGDKWEIYFVIVQFSD